MILTSEDGIDGEVRDMGMFPDDLRAFGDMDTVHLVLVI